MTITLNTYRGSYTFNNIAEAAHIIRKTFSTSTIKTETSHHLIAPYQRARIVIDPFTEQEQRIEVLPLSATQEVFDTVCGVNIKKAA